MNAYQLKASYNGALLRAKEMLELAESHLHDADDLVNAPPNLFAATTKDECDKAIQLFEDMRRLVYRLHDVTIPPPNLRPKE